MYTSFVPCALLVLSLAGCAGKQPTDTGAPDTGTTDTSTTDTSTTDTGTADTGTTDTGTADTGTSDTGTADTGTTDTGTADTGTTDTGTADTGTSDTGPVSYTLGDAHSGWTLKIDGTTTCDLAWDLTGTEYDATNCPDCDYAFLVTSSTLVGADTGDTGGLDTGGAYSGVTGCQYAGWPQYRGPWFGNGTGFAFLSSGDLTLYGGDQVDSVTNGFFVFSNSGGSMAAPGFYSGQVDVTFYSTDYGTEDYGSNFTNDAGAISWDSTNTFQSGVFADTRCPGQAMTSTSSSGLDTADQSVITADGVIGDCTTNMDDSFTVDVDPGATLEASVDVTDGAKLFDSRIWINDPSGCTVEKGDDEFPCTAGDCTWEGLFTYSCCSAVSVTNWGSTTMTYTIFVASTTWECDDSGHTGPYTLAVKGGTELTPAHDDYNPTISKSFTGSAVLTPQ